MNIEWEKVDSTAVSHMAYSEEEGKMYVRYASGDEYEYEVSYDEYLSVKEAPSIGRALRLVGTRGVRI